MKNKFPVAAVVGAVAGIVAGVLTAPKSGKESRKTVRNNAENLNNKALQIVGNVLQRSKMTILDIQKKAKARINK